eukprot:1302629-Alexandrium_andersonii.AAC.1
MARPRWRRPRSGRGSGRPSSAASALAAPHPQEAGAAPVSPPAGTSATEEGEEALTAAVLVELLAARDGEGRLDRLERALAGSAPA